MTKPAWPTNEQIVEVILNNAEDSFPVLVSVPSTVQSSLQGIFAADVVIILPVIILPPWDTRQYQQIGQDILLPQHRHQFTKAQLRLLWLPMREPEQWAGIATRRFAPQGNHHPSAGRRYQFLHEWNDVCKRRSDNVPRRRLDSLIVAVENRTACHLPIESIETLMEGDYGCTSWTCIFAYAGRAWWRG